MPTKRQVFYSFHYEHDNARASLVRNIGVVEGNKPASDNDWERLWESAGGRLLYSDELNDAPKETAIAFGRTVAMLAGSV